MARNYPERVKRAVVRAWNEQNDGGMTLTQFSLGWGYPRSTVKGWIDKFGDEEAGDRVVEKKSRYGHLFRDITVLSAATFIVGLIAMICAGRIAEFWSDSDSVEAPDVVERVALVARSIDVPQVLQVGQSVKISVTSDSRDSGVVRLTLVGPAGDHYLDVPIDESGKGAATWTVPNWPQVTVLGEGGPAPTRNVMIAIPPPEDEFDWPPVPISPAPTATRAAPESPS